MGVWRRPWLIAGLIVLLSACERHDVEIELPASGRSLSAAEQRELQRVADGAFREVRGLLVGLPPRLTLVVRWGSDVIPETGENGTASFPGRIGWTLDPERDALSIIRTQLRPTLFHELHHLARASRTASRSLVDQVVTEGLATAFERDFGQTTPPWGQAPPEIMEWTRELLRQPDTSDQAKWLVRHPDGRRWVGMRVGTFLVDRAARASGRTAASLVFTETAEVVRLADIR